MLTLSLATVVLSSLAGLSQAADLSGSISFPYVQQPQWQADMLAVTNKYRAMHGAAPVTWNTDLANFAAQNAAQFNWAHSGGPYGENIATGSYLDPDYYVFLWYDEVKKYNFANPGFSDETGHFTQLVWASTTQIGCAMHEGTNSAGFPYSLTCEYNPPGNVNNAGYFSSNVKPAVTSSASTKKVSFAGLCLAALTSMYML